MKKVLVINCGSSSIKYKLFIMPKARLVAQGLIERIGERGSKISNHHQGVELVLSQTDGIDVVGHRVVHGGEKFKEPALINEQTIKNIRDCIKLAPLHNPANLEGILACKRLLPNVPQVAVFDTAFYQALPDYAYIYAIPYEYYQKLRIRRYGFHGTSHEYVAHEAARILKKPLSHLKLITCHLGNGCSITAVNKGKPVDTSMGFTPLEGLVMGTRCGDIDPALVTYIMQSEGKSIQEIDNILNKQSGLKGISGVSNDMRALEKASAGNKRCRLAIDVFIHRIKKYIGAYCAIMGGADAVVFTAGIGEHQADVRSRVCRDALSFFKKKPRVLVIPTNEELMIARQADKLTEGKRA